MVKNLPTKPIILYKDIIVLNVEKQANPIEYSKTYINYITTKAQAFNTPYKPRLNKGKDQAINKSQVSQSTQSTILAIDNQYNLYVKP
jgi:hypothetical protein